MKNATRTSALAVASAVSWFSTHDQERDHREDRQVAKEWVDVHAVIQARTPRAAASKRSDGEPEQARPRLGRRVQPRREDAQQRERAVGVVQVVLRAVVVGEQQQPERDLADDQRLREREQLRDRRSRRGRGGTRRTRRPTRRRRPR